MAHCTCKDTSAERQPESDYNSQMTYSRFDLTRLRQPGTQTNLRDAHAVIELDSLSKRHDEIEKMVSRAEKRP